MEILYKNYTHLCKFLNESIKHSAVNSVNRFTSLMYIAVQFYNQIGWYKGQSVFEKFYCSSDDDFYLICYICYGRPNISITQSFGKWKLYSLYWPAKAKDIKFIWKKKEDIYLNNIRVSMTLQCNTDIVYTVVSIPYLYCLQS